jgi:hypothetical protein
MNQNMDAKSFKKNGCKGVAFLYAGDPEGLNHKEFILMLVTL